MRTAFVDVETTGLTPRLDRVVEIAVAIAENRRVVKTWQSYIKPPIRMTADATAVNGITDEFLADKPVFEDIKDEFFAAMAGMATIIAHNAPFDAEFLDYECEPYFVVGHTARERWAGDARIICSLELARRLRPGKRNNLDAVCKAYGVKNRRGEYHGALCDVLMLADAYHAMTAGQDEMELDQPVQVPTIKPLSTGLLVVRANAEELAAHEAWLQRNKQAAW